MPLFFRKAIERQKTETPEGRLAAAVLNQAYADSLKIRGENNEPRMFLTTPSLSLSKWCDAAGLKEEFVMDIAKKEFLLRDKWKIVRAKSR